MKDLASYASNVTSQHGEDGILARIFSIVEPVNQWCLECGALDGKKDSNVWNLIANFGWRALLVEADRSFFKKLTDRYVGNERVVCMNAFVTADGPDTMDALCARAGLPKDFDLFVLDIDSNDYHVWKSMTAYRPRIVVIEFNPSIPNDISFVQPSDPEVFQGSSLRALVELGKEKGYELIATVVANAIFCERALFPAFGIEDNSIDALHTDTQYYTRLYQLYDGTLKIAGYDRLIWKRIPIDQERLQVVPRRKRRYPAHIDSNSIVRFLKEKIRRMPGYRLAQRIRKAF